MKSQDNTKNLHATVESLVAPAFDTSDDPSLDNKVDSMSAGMGTFNLSERFPNVEEDDSENQ